MFQWGQLALPRLTRVHLWGDPSQSCFSHYCSDSWLAFWNDREPWESPHLSTALLCQLNKEGQSKRNHRGNWKSSTKVTKSKDLFTLSRDRLDSNFFVFGRKKKSRRSVWWRKEIILPTHSYILADLSFSSSRKYNEAWGFIMCSTNNSFPDLPLACSHGEQKHDT